MLSSTKCLVAYSDVGNSDYGTSIILNISTDTITSGTAYVFESAGTTFVSAVMLTSTKCLVAYKDNGNSSYGTSIILNISTDTITAGTAFVFQSTESVYASTVMLSSTKVLVAYREMGTFHSTSIILNVDGSDNITAGTAYVFDSGDTTSISAVALSSTKVLVAYRDVGNSNYGTAIILNVSTNTITSGTAFVFESNATTYISVAGLSSTKCLVAYKSTIHNYGTAIILNVSTDTITSGTAYVFESAVTNYISAAKLSSTKVLVAYDDNGNSDYGTSIILNVDGSDAITAGTAYVFESASTTFISAVMLSSTKCLVAYRDVGNGNYGTSIILNVSA